VVSAQSDVFPRKKNAEYVEKHRKKKAGLLDEPLIEQAKNLFKINKLSKAEIRQHGIWG
jgi:hypothetical protein